MKIRVLHLVLSLDMGGLENGVVNIINGLNDDKFESVLCCIKHKGDMVDRLRKEINVIELNHYGDITPSVLFQLRKIIKQYKIDIVHSRNFKPYKFGFFSGVLLSGKTLVHSEHGKDYPFKKTKMILHRFFSYFTETTIALSSDIKKNMIDYVGVSNQHIKVVINGVDTDKFKPGERKQTLLNELDISDKSVVVGSVGRVVEVKNYSDLLNAFKVVYTKVPEAILLVVGDGPLLEKIKQEASALSIGSAVRFLGKRNDINDILDLIDVYALTSWNEGISNTLLEAMSSGKPVVVSDVGGNNEIVKHEEVGYLYKSGNRDELSFRLIELIENVNLRMEFSANARKHVVDNYSLQTMIKNYETVYTEAINE